MSLVTRLGHAHYISNAALVASFPLYLVLARPEYLSSTTLTSYLRYLMPILALCLVKFKGAQSAEELMSILYLYGKVIALYGFWTLRQDPITTLPGTTSWSGNWRIALVLAAWTFTFINFPQPAYRGPSKIRPLSAKDLEAITTSTASASKGKSVNSKRTTSSSTTTKSSTLRQRETATTASSPKIVELDENDEPIQDIDSVDDTNDNNNNNNNSNNDQVEELVVDSSHYWIVAFNATWCTPCRHFEAVLARTSIKYASKTIHFAKIDLDLEEQGEVIAEKFGINMAATTIDLPTLVLFRDGKKLKQLPPKLGDFAGGQVLDKVGWDRSEDSVVQAFELQKLSTGQESFLRR